MEKFIENEMGYLIKKCAKERDERKIITKKYGLEKNKYFLFMSDVVPEKGIHYLIEAYKIINTEKMLVIAGNLNLNTEYIKKLKKKVGNNSNIVFTGLVNSKILKELFLNSYIHILPCKKNGLIYTDIKSESPYNNSRIICCKENKKIINTNGILFNKENILDIANKLKRSEIYYSDNG